MTDREIINALSAAIMAMVQHHVLTLKMSPREFTDQDIDLGNNVEFQNGFVSALEMVTDNYIGPLVAAHNLAVCSGSVLPDPAGEG